MLNEAERFDQELMFYLQNNMDAFQFCKELLYVMHLWDDLIDKDKIRSDAEINAAFMVLCSSVPSNHFFQRNLPQLTLLMTVAALLWQHSNELEPGTDDQRFAAFMVRQGVHTVIYYCGYIIGGYPWVLEHGPKFLSVLTDGMTERFEQFQAEMDHKYPRDEMKESKECGPSLQ